jgi:hypothetical protein
MPAGEHDDARRPITDSKGQTLQRKVTLADWRFETAVPILVPPGKLSALHLVTAGPEADDAAVATSQSGDVTFRSRGWYEVLLTVEWDPDDHSGTRFSHTKVPGEQPLHSEAIAADVLSRISNGRQLLRGNGIFGPGADENLILEVWHDSSAPVEVRQALILVRDLHRRLSGQS